MVRPKGSSLCLLRLKPSKIGDSTIRDLIRASWSGWMPPPEPTLSLQPPPAFWGAPYFFPLRALLWINFGRPPCPMGATQAWRGATEQGSSIPPWSWVGTHRPSWISPNLNILRPLLGPGGVAWCLPPCHLLFVCEEGDTRLGLCHRPPPPQHFALPLQDPKNTSEEILVWISSGQGKARSWLCLLHPILCPSPKSLSPSMVLPTGTRPPRLQNQVV